jgi:hypothetical protein
MMRRSTRKVEGYGTMAEFAGFAILTNPFGAEEVGK